MNRVINVLLIEDNPDDAIIIEERLQDRTHSFHGGVYRMMSAATVTEGRSLIKENQFDIILLDLHLPDSMGMETFIKISEAAPDTPIILLTNINDEDLTISLMNLGAQDYLYKSELQSVLLQRAIRYALQRYAIIKEKHDIIGELQNALGEVKRLRGLLPICSKCKKIRTDEGFWKQVDEYVSDHSETRFTHGLCPDCTREIYTEHYMNSQ